MKMKKMKKKKEKKLMEDVSDSKWPAQSTL